MPRRALASATVAAMLIAGCATGGPSRSTTELAESKSAPVAPRRCSPEDPDRWAWFCVIGQILYSVVGGSESVLSRGVK